MALAGELAKYVGNELVKTGSKELAKAGAKSALSSLVPSVATKLGTELATKAGTELATKSVLNSLVPTASRKLASGIELGTDIIPMFRGQEHRLDQLDYNKGLSPNSNGFFMTPNKSATDSWAGKGVVSVGADPNDIMTLDELNALKKSAERYYRDPKYQMELYNTNPTQAEIYDALEAGDSYQELSRLTKKPFIERDGGQGTELGEVVFFPDTNPELTSRYNADLASGKNQWLAPTEDVVASETSVPAGTKIKFDKDLNIKDIEKPSRGRGWYADNETNPHISQMVKQNGLDKYLGEPKISQSIDDSMIPIYHGTPNKFEDFDDSLPSVWFSDSNKNLKDTGLTMKGGNDINVMERMLPRDLKIADEDLADKLTKQQLQDRGYAGIAYTERGPNGDETYYEIFSPNKTLRKIPKVSQSLDYGGYGSYDKNVKRVGSSAVAPVREETLPDGWKELEKYLDTSNDRLSLAIGKPRSKITKQDLINFLEDNGYDTEGTKDDLWKNALMCIDDMAVDDLYNAGGSAGEFLQERLPFRHNDKLTDATNYYIGTKGRTGRLDAEYSDRLGIGRSNTPMSDRLVNPYSAAGGDYSKGAFGTNASWAEGESGVSTSAHERMHAWQDINKFDWDEEVGDAIDELRGELKKFYHDEDTIKKYWGNSRISYHMENDEQEARMLQSYLDNEGYTNSYRKNSEKGTEWGDEIKPAFDKFFKKLRTLSKKGIALPAVAGLVGIGTLAGKKDGKKLDNIK